MPPDVLSYNIRGIQTRLKPSMVLTIGPMLTCDDIIWQTGDDEWVMHTIDSRDAAHWKHSITIIEDSISVLTARDKGVASLVPHGVTPVSLD